MEMMFPVTKELGNMVFRLIGFETNNALDFIQIIGELNYFTSPEFHPLQYLEDQLSLGFRLSFLFIYDDQPIGQKAKRDQNS
jgi:hypothetical protein